MVVQITICSHVFYLQKAGNLSPECIWIHFTPFYVSQLDKDHLKNKEFSTSKPKTDVFNWRLDNTTVSDTNSF